jgi:hypothetical protein
MTSNRDIQIVYGPPSKERSLNKEAIKYLLNCDVAFDYHDQHGIREALKDGRSVLVFADDAKPKVFRGYHGLFDGAEATSLDVIRRILGRRWVEGGPTQSVDGAEEGMARTLSFPPYQIHLLLIVREDFFHKAKRHYISDDTRKSYEEAAETINQIIGILEDRLAS